MVHSNAYHQLRSEKTCLGAYINPQDDVQTTPQDNEDWTLMSRN